MPEPKPKNRILYVSYDPGLLLSRQIMLEKMGYEVVTAQGVVEASMHGKQDFSLIILGHTVDTDEKRLIVARLRRNGCHAPVLSLLRRGAHPIPEAARAIEPSNERVAEAVRSMIQD